MATSEGQGDESFLLLELFQPLEGYARRGLMQIGLSLQGKAGRQTTENPGSGKGPGRRVSLWDAPQVPCGTSSRWAQSTAWAPPGLSRGARAGVDTVALALSGPPDRGARGAAEPVPEGEGDGDGHSA